MWTQVESYSLGYNIGTKEFYVYYQLKGQTVSNQLFVDAHTFMALADMFRNEGPVNFNSQGNYFATGAEPIGEGERRR